MENIATIKEKINVVSLAGIPFLVNEEEITEYLSLSVFVPSLSFITASNFEEFTNFFPSSARSALLSAVLITLLSSRNSVWDFVIL